MRILALVFYVFAVFFAIYAVVEYATKSGHARAGGLVYFIPAAISVALAVVGTAIKLLSSNRREL